MPVTVCTESRTQDALQRGAYFSISNSNHQEILTLLSTVLAPVFMDGKLLFVPTVPGIRLREAEENRSRLLHKMAINL
jgi:hypothetical protein